MGLGIAHLSFWGSGPQGNASISGIGFATSVSFGGAIARGLVLGGGLRFAYGGGPFAGSPVDAQGNGSANLVESGVLVDWYPAPEDGWHIGGKLGLGSEGVSDSFPRYSTTDWNFASALLGGYDWWIAPQWSLGMLMSLATAASAALKDSNGQPTGYSFTPLIVALEVSLLRH
jgi:hypothetical protein